MQARLLADGLAEVLVVALQELALRVEVQRRRQGALPHTRQSEMTTPSCVSYLREERAVMHNKITVEIHNTACAGLIAEDPSLTYGLLPNRSTVCASGKTYVMSTALHCSLATHGPPAPPAQSDMFQSACEAA